MLDPDVSITATTNPETREDREGHEETRFAVIVVIP
jgi:hypothetical protein